MDLRTSYLGLRLAHPFIAGASPLGGHLDAIKRLEDAGCAAIVLPSLFEEQITYEYSGQIAQANAFEPEFKHVLAAFPAPSKYALGPAEYAEHVYRAKQAVGIPIIGSLNGRTAESWLKFAHVIERAGADALELNMYDVPTEATTPGAAIESTLVGLVRDLKGLVKIPIALKLSPFFTVFANIAHRLDEAGADGLVLFNRFYAPDIDVRTRSLSPRIDLSTSSELLLRLHWVAILHGRVRCSVAVSGGVAEPEDGIKAVLAGADAIQMTSALLRHGPSHIARMREGLERWLAWHHMEGLDEARAALSFTNTPDRASLERANYIDTLHSWAY